MIRNYIKIAWRTLLKEKQFTVLNMLGLSVGIACTFLIYLWVNDEMSFDKFFEKDSQLYQLLERRSAAGLIGISDESSGMLGETLKMRMPEIEYSAAVAPPDWWQKFTLSVNEKNIKASGQYVGPDYFNVFSFKLIDGKKDAVLKDKTSIVISDELARKLFGTTENIIGKAIRLQQEKDFFVSGVFEKIPFHSSAQFDFVMSFEYLKDIQGWVKSWGSTGPHNFVLLKKGTDIASFNRQIANIISENTNDTTRKVFAARFSDGYLTHTFDHGAQVASKIGYVKLFSLIAIFILVIACVNFMNLSTAKAARRMKEVGIKKVVGATRGQLIFQFISESVLLALISMLLAIGLSLLLLPRFNALTGKEISLTFEPKVIIAFIGITIFTGFLSGSYPALYLSKFKPLAVLKGKLTSSLSELISRKGLVVFQFTLSVVLIVAVIVVYQQIQYIQATNPGYNKDNVIRFNAEGKLLGNEETFIADLKKIPGVAGASYTFNNMVGRIYGDYSLDWDGKDPDASIYFEGFGVSFDFIPAMGMQLVAGRNFSREFGDESDKIILNEAAVRIMRIKDPVGKMIKMNDRPNQIIGVVKDFHFESLHEPVKQSYMKLTGQGNSWNKMMVRIRAGKERETISQIQKVYEGLNPGFPFEYNFLDDAYQKQYLSETRVGILSRYFAGLAIFISCLGLFGLAAFTAQKRQKEIGIRKVIGASVNNIVLMLSQDFLRLTIIAVCIAFPLAWWAMNSWLQSFAYRVNLSPVVFVLAGLSVVLITLFTVSFQAIKAAIANPVKSLRTE